MFLVRKIARAKWDATRNAERGLADGEISADAITVDLRTQGGTLSFWRSSSEAAGDLEDAALAIAAAGQRLDRIEVVWLAIEDLQADGHILRNSPGQTPVADLAERHVDICQLDYVRLGKVAQRVVEAIRLQRYRRFTRKRIKPNELVEGLKKDLGLSRLGGELNSPSTDLFSSTLPHLPVEGRTITPPIPRICVSFTESFPPGPPDPQFPRVSPFQRREILSTN